MKNKNIILLFAFTCLFNQVIKSQNAYNNALVLKTYQEDFLKNYPSDIKNYIELLEGDKQMLDTLTKAKVDSLRNPELVPTANISLFKRLQRDTANLRSRKVAIDKELASVKADEKDLSFVESFIKNPYSTALVLPDTLNLKPLVARMEIRKERMTRESMGIMSEREIGISSYNSVIGAASQLRGIPSLSILSPTQVIDGIALFLRDRVVEEINMAFLVNFQKNLNDDKLRYLGTLFPKTKETLTNFLAAGTQMMSVNNVLRTSFHADIDGLPNNIENFLLTVLADKEKNEPNVKYFIMPLTLIRHTYAGSHPAKFFQDITDKYFTGDFQKDRFAQVMNFVSVLNEDLVRIDDNNGNTKNQLWISETEWQQNLGKDGNAQDLFMGLVYQKCRKRNMGIAGKDVFRTTFKKYITDYIDLIGSLDNNFNRIHTKGNRDIRDSLVLDMAWQTVKLIDRNFNAFNTMFEVKKDSSMWQDYRPIAESTLMMFSSLRQKNYGAAVLNGYSVLAKTILTQSEVNSKFLQNFLFYGSFVSDVLLARGADDVSRILTSYAAPIGSYTVKNRARWTVSVNAYPGVFGGIEFAGVDTIKNSYVMGVTAPIGLNISTKTLTRRGNLSFFVPIIDIGAMLSYRFRNDRFRGLPDDITWEQILSPGLTVRYGFRQLPLSIGFGWQATPKLRGIQNQSLVLNAVDTGRFSVSATVDIPVFFLYRSPNK